MELISNKSKVLRSLAENFDFDNPQCDPVKLFEDMRNTMCSNKGIGLAAPQVGLSYKMFVIGDPSTPESCIPVFNPSIVSVSDETVTYEEGCLSFPGLYISIKRPRNIRARFANQNGEVNTVQFDGLTARTFQHEYDHIYGILYTSRANIYHLEKARKDLKLIQRRRARAK